MRFGSLTQILCWLQAGGVGGVLLQHADWAFEST
jgi:hypothetical protein